MGNWQAQVGDAGFKIIHEAGHRTRQARLVVGDDTLGEIACDGPAWCLICRLDAQLELGPGVFGDFGGEIAQAMRQAALTCRAREAGLDRLDDAGRPVPRRPAAGRRGRGGACPGRRPTPSRRPPWNRPSATARSSRRRRQSPRPAAPARAVDLAGCGRQCGR